MCDHGKACAASADDGTVIALVGNMGAGKTHWTQGFVAGIGSTSQVTSPTFALLNEYTGGRLPVFHFDFHRIESSRELLAIGWDETLEREGIVIVEWADKFPDLMPRHTRWIHIQSDGENTRLLTEHNP